MISKLMTKMIAYSNGNLHDINHFLKVYAYAKIIGESEYLDKVTQMILEASAIVHDIACPLCREKYGNTNGKYQEYEGMILTRDFLKEMNLSESFVERVVYLVGHHHTLSEIDGPDYQILIEADYLVNAEENVYSKEHIQMMKDQYFKTDTGKQLLEIIYGL